MSSVTKLRVGDEDFLVTSMIERCPKSMMLRELVKNFGHDSLTTLLEGNFMPHFITALARRRLTSRSRWSRETDEPTSDRISVTPDPRRQDNVKSDRKPS